MYSLKALSYYSKRLLLLEIPIYITYAVLQLAEHQFTINNHQKLTDVV